MCVRSLVFWPRQNCPPVTWYKHLLCQVWTFIAFCCYVWCWDRQTDGRTGGQLQCVGPLYGFLSRDTVHHIQTTIALLQVVCCYSFQESHAAILPLGHVIFVPKQCSPYSRPNGRPKSLAVRLCIMCMQRCSLKCGSCSYRHSDSALHTRRNIRRQTGTLIRMAKFLENYITY